MALPASPKVKPPVTDASPKSAATPSKRAPVAPVVAREFFRPVTVRADQVLANVNGKPVQLKDLVPLPPEDTEKAMTAEEYQSPLNRAIEAELTFQAAQIEGVGLTAEQRQRLVRIGQNHKARLAEYQQQGIPWSSVTPTQLEFERRLMSALMLQQNLLAKVAAVAPSLDTATQARYEQALQDILGRLKANAAISASTPAL